MDNSPPVHVINTPSTETDTQTVGDTPAVAVPPSVPLPVVPVAVADCALDGEVSRILALTGELPIPLRLPRRQRRPPQRYTPIERPLDDDSELEEGWDNSSDDMSEDEEDGLEKVIIEDADYVPDAADADDDADWGAFEDLVVWESDTNMECGYNTSTSDAGSDVDSDDDDDDDVDNDVDDDVDNDVDDDVDNDVDDDVDNDVVGDTWAM